MIRHISSFKQLLDVNQDTMTGRAYKALSTGADYVTERWVQAESE